MVVDASVVVDAVVDPAGPAMATMLAATTLDAPELLILEVAAALRNRLIRGLLTRHDAEEALKRARRLPIDKHPVDPLIGRAWELRANLTPYDAAYVALAEKLDTRAAVTSRVAGRCRGR